MATSTIKAPNKLQSEILHIEQTTDQYGQAYVLPQSVVFASGKVFAVYSNTTYYISNVSVGGDNRHLYIQFRKQADNTAAASTAITADVLLLGYIS